MDLLEFHKFILVYIRKFSLILAKGKVKDLLLNISLIIPSLFLKKNSGTLNH